MGIAHLVRAVKWLREPLVQFLIGGAVLFGAWRLGHPVAVSDAHRIVITPDFVDGLREDATRRTGHPPTTDELKALVQRAVDEEVLYREAMRLGLDRGDVIVRRRLVEKMEFLTEDSSHLREPTDAELTTWLRDHANEYAHSERVSFRHVFLKQEHGANAAALLARLNAGEAPDALGDPFVAGTAWAERSQAQVAATFGEAFAGRLWALPAVKDWAGPIESTYGSHLVQVQSRTPSQPPALDEVREKVRSAWLDARRKDANREALRKAEQRYLVELPAGIEAKVAAAR